MPSKLVVWIAIGAALQAAASGAPTSNNRVCTTQQCVLMAADIIRDMHPDVDPCVDFNEYACGGFFDNSDIPPSETEVDSLFSHLSKSNRAIIRKIVDPKSPNAHKTAEGDVAAANNVKKMQAAYVSCMNVDNIASVGRKPLQDDIHKLVQMFPVSDSALPTTSTSVLSSSNIDKQNLAITLGYFVGQGLDTPLGLYPSTDVKNPDKTVLVIAENGLGLGSKSNYADTRITSVYQTTIASMFSLVLGDGPQNSTTANATTSWTDVAKDIYSFEQALAEISSSPEDMMDPLLTQIAALTPSVDWPVIFEKALPPGTKVPEPLTVASKDYLPKLEALLQNTSPKTMQSYLAWVMIRKNQDSLDSVYQKPMKALDQVLSGVSASTIDDRSKTCVSFVNRMVGELPGHYFVQQAFSGDSRKEVESIIANLQNTYTKSFPKYAWLDKKTLQGALTKMVAMGVKVGWSVSDPDTSSSASLDQYYKALELKEDDYYGNTVRASMWQTQKAFGVLGKAVDNRSLGMPPQTVNAFYDPSANQISFPAGILQPPAFHVDNPDYANYGAIGVIAGHEITHGFDNQGHMFDSRGKMENWWTNSTEEAFNTRASCFVYQYGNFTIKDPLGKETHLNGHLTLGENIADNGGLKKAFETWQARYRSDPSGKTIKNPRLPGLEALTPEQLFFVSYARLWCSKARPEALLQQVMTDPHSPAEWRIKGAVQNSKYFAKAFKCKAGAPMNPVKKCDLMAATCASSLEVPAADIFPIHSSTRFLDLEQ
ncbi:hypothetical protein BGZ81_004080 [Podila clonocystis]|nr:hypothetical protein BGZ81_004080 [Podila clonocystis]